MKNLIIPFVFLLSVLLVSCSQETPVAPKTENQQSVVNNTKSSVKEKKAQDLLCPTPNIDFFYTNMECSSQSCLIRTPTTPYSTTWHFSVSNLSGWFDTNPEIWVLIDGITVFHDGPLKGNEEFSGTYSLGYGVHAFQINVRNHGILGSTASASYSATLDIERPINPNPPVISGSVSGNHPAIIWGAVNADGYIVYESLNGGSTFSQVGSTTGLSYAANDLIVWTPGNTKNNVLFKVKAYTNAGGVSDYSNVVQEIINPPLN